MAKISELTGAERESRIAELKAKMKESAARVKAAHAAGEAPTRSEAAVAVAEAPAIEEAPIKEVTIAPDEGALSKPTALSNGTAAAKPAAAPKAAPKPKADDVEPAPVLTPKEMNRREFLTYAWGASLGLLGLEAGVASFQFLYPRFRAGEFGGAFFLPLSEVPDSTVPPIPYTSGKFWLVRTAEGDPKALYMVCTHLGCLYKWESSNVRFECPCHGSKFSHDGFYIEGPAPRSLDYFDVTVEDDQVVVDTGARNIGAPAVESPSRIAPV